MDIDKHDFYELNILKHVEETPQLTNRTAAGKLGVSVKLAHGVLKQMVTKGLLHVRVVNSRRWDYFLTPKGIAEKARITREFVQFSMQFFREARKRSAQLCRDLKEAGKTEVAFLGAGELAEIAYLGACEWDLKVVAVFDDETVGKTFFGAEVRPLKALTTAQDIIVCVYEKAEPMRSGFLPRSVPTDGHYHWIF
jgi:DNA-binding MarR family transcriptional regulator